MTTILIIAVILAFVALAAWFYLRRLAAAKPSTFTAVIDPPAATLPIRDASWHVARFERALEQTTACKARRLELIRWRDYYAALADIKKPE